MRLLVSEYAADPSKTDDVLWCGTPPLFVAEENGQLEALKFYVSECKQDIGFVDNKGYNILKNIELVQNWRELDDHIESHKWAKALLKKQKKKRK
jgi:hypothetical protein